MAGGQAKNSDASVAAAPVSVDRSRGVGHPRWEQRHPKVPYVEMKYINHLPRRQALGGRFSPSACPQPQERSPFQVLEARADPGVQARAATNCREKPPGLDPTRAPGGPPDQQEPAPESHEACGHAHVPQALEDPEAPQGAEPSPEKPEKSYKVTRGRARGGQGQPPMFERSHECQGKTTLRATAHMAILAGVRESPSA